MRRFVVLCVLVGCGSGSHPMFADDHPRIYLQANRDRLVAALDAQDPAATRFRDMVDSQLAGTDNYGFESWYAALMGQLTGDASYCDYAVERTDAFVKSEEDLIRSGEKPTVAGDSYLEVGPVIGDVMLTYDWCFDHISSGEKELWLDYAGDAVWNVWHPADATWGAWSGWATDDPSDNYYYSFLRATMMFGLAAHGEHPDADGWLDFFRDQKVGDQLVPTFDQDLVGGGSREGTGYGVSMHKLWELYDWWQASTGEDIADLTPHTRASLLYYVHAIAPTRDYVAPIGDHSRDSTAALFDYERNYIQELSYLYQDDSIVPQAKYLLSHSSVPEMGQLFMYVYDFLYGTTVDEAPEDSLGHSWYGPGIGEVFTRSGWDEDATWVSFIAGPYTQSHAHRDQGSFMLYKQGWLAYDPVYDSHSGIRQEEELHNLVRLEGMQQQSGTESHVLAIHHGDGWFHVAADLAPAYGDAAPAMDQRELVYLEPDVLVVYDRVTTDGGTAQTWQLNTPTQPQTSGANATIGDLHVARIAPASGVTTSVYDWTQDSDFSGGFRLDEQVAGGANRMLHVLSVGGAVTSATGDGTHVDLTLADGRTATVTFGSTGLGGHLTVHGPSGDIDVRLDAGLDPLPE